MRNFRQLLKTFILFSLYCSSAIYAQMSMPEMPSIQSIPSMPSISTPTYGKSFYTPTVKSSYTEKKSQQVPETQTNTNKSNSNENINNTNLNNKAIDSKRILTSLSASELSSLSNNGLFNGVYNLLSNDEMSINSSNTNTMLSTIMTELEQIKQNQETELNNKNTNDNKNNFAYIQNEDISSPSILRFNVNGYNIIDSLRTVYFSKKENDGTFLLTADRKYFADGKTRSETFYLLFKADGNCGASKGFKIQPAIIQDYENKNSFIYKLCNEENITASKTGNLVTMRIENQNIKADLLLNIGNQ